MSTSAPPRRRFTTREFHKMAEAGILAPEERLELMDGEILAMVPIGTRHASTVNRIIRLLGKKLPSAFLLQVQNPILLDDESEPQPDFAIVDAHKDFYASEHPRPENVRLLIEVSDSTLAQDRDVKLPAYARAGIPEVWIVNLPQEAVEVYAEPEAGVYRKQSIHVRGQKLAPRAAPRLNLRILDILGPPPA